MQSDKNYGWINKTALAGISFFIILFFSIFYILPLMTKQISSPVKKIYFADNIYTAHSKLINRFNEKYKGEIEVMPINLPFSKFSTNERKELLARSLRSNSERLDIFTVDLIWVPRFARWAENLNTDFSIREREKIEPFALESCYFEDNLVAIPFYIDIGLLYYRSDIIEKLPNSSKIIEKLKQSISWEEFIGLRNKLPEYQNKLYLFPANNYEGLVCSFMELVLSQDPDIFESEYIDMNTAPVRKSLQLLVDLVNKYRITPPEVLEYDEFKCYLYAVKHQVPFVRGWPGFKRHYRPIIQDTITLEKYEHAALPHFEGTRPLSVYGGWNLMVPVASTNKKEAITFIKFILEPDNQKMMYEEVGYVPINSEVYSDSAFVRKHPLLLYYRELLNRGIHRPKMTNYTKISDIISYYANLAIKQEISVEKALLNCTADINNDWVVIK